MSKLELAHGIDCNEYVPSWHGYDFGMVKATEGDYYTNPDFTRNWDEMKKAGILSRFAYHYARPSLDPSVQARKLVEHVRTVGLDQHDHFVLDLEETDGLKPYQVSFWAWVFATEVNRLAPGHRCLIYTYPAFAHAGNCARLGSWFLWIADYGVAAPDVPPPWRTWTFWQWKPGTQVDWDLFNGTRTQMDYFTSHSGPA